MGKSKPKHKLNPLRLDPSRTGALRREIVRVFRIKFRRLRLELHDLIVKEDALGIDPRRRPLFTLNECQTWILVVNNNPEGCNQYTGPDCEGTSSNEPGAKPGSKFLKGVKVVVGKVGEWEHAAKEFTADKVEKGISKLPPKLQTATRLSLLGAKLAGKVAFIPWTASQAFAEKVAREKGATEEQARRLRGILAATDVMTFKPISVALASAGVGTAAVGAVSMIPPATAAYLAYSTARNPMATYRAAKDVAKQGAKTIGKGLAKAGNMTLVGLEEVSKLTGNAELDNVEYLTEALRKVDYDDWFIALLMARYELDEPVMSAIRHALSDYRELPQPPKSYFPQEMIANVDGRWRLMNDPDKVAAFRQWLKGRVGHHFTGKDEQELLRRYVEAGLKKGAARSFQDVTRKKPGQVQPIIPPKKSPKHLGAYKSAKKGFTGEQEPNQQPLSPAMGKPLGFYEGSREEFLRSAFRQPEAINKVKLLASRTFDDLENVTEQMSRSIVRTLTDGLVQGKHPLEIAEDIDVPLGSYQGRAETIARTEIIRAHAEGQLMAMDELGVEEVGVMVEWRTADDDAVCPLCEPMEGVVLKLDEATGMLPRHPNCRCAWVPANVGEDKEDQTRGKSAVEKAIGKSIDRAGGNVDEDSGWNWGPGEKISKERPTSRV